MLFNRDVVDLSIRRVMELRHRAVSREQMRRFEGYIAEIFAACEHHALPFHGHAYVGYIAHEHLIGISKLTRLVCLFAKRFTVQERLGEQIVNTFDAMLEPHRVAVYLQDHHLCIEMRGVREITPLTRTTFWRGEYENNAALRTEFFDMCRVRL